VFITTKAQSQIPTKAQSQTGEKVAA
jgi:hypothetical protein